MPKPWAQPTEEELNTTLEADVEIAPIATGPDVPQPTNGIAPVDRADQLGAVQTTVEQNTIYIVGCHGGSGESTVEGFSPHFVGLQGRWPQAVETAPVILVARTHYQGIASAGAAIRHWASGDLKKVRLLGLIWVPDSKARLPRELRTQAHILSGAAARTWNLPWVEEWRIGPPDLNKLPKEVSKLVDESQRLISEERK